VQRLTESAKQALLERYSGKFKTAVLSYGTVRDYCNSCDYLPGLSSVQNDLKDLQRPWAVKVTLGLLPPGSTLLEIGAGEPLVATTLADLGYSVTVVDPYDGSGGGPTSFERFARSYPHVRIIRDEFCPMLPQLINDTFDGIYSISVLEHVPEPSLGAIFQAISQHLRTGGWSFHSVDCVIQGTQTPYHLEQCRRVADYQSKLAGQAINTDQQFHELCGRAHADVDTYYLSASGHNLWRGNVSYDEFPFRKVISVQFAAPKAAA
jgi:Methyltransferase domain